MRRRCAPGSTRRWRPRLSAELYKAQNIVRQFAQVGALYPERSIPAAVLDGAAGFAVLSVVKVGAFDALTAQLLVSSWGGHGQTSLLMHLLLMWRVQAATYHGTTVVLLQRVMLIVNEILLWPLWEPLSHLVRISPDHAWPGHTGGHCRGCSACNGPGLSEM